MAMEDKEAFSRELLRALTMARNDPTAVARRLHARLSRYKGRDYQPPVEGRPVQVKKEGASAVEDAIHFLSSQVPLPFNDSSPGEGLSLAAEDHCLDIGPRGAVGHTGSDGSSPSQHAERYGTWTGANGECLWFGKIASDTEAAQNILDDLIIDDGVADRGHRLSIFNEKFNAAGCAIGLHSVFGYVVAIEFVGGWEEGSSAASERDADRAARIASLPAAAPMASTRTQWVGELGQCVSCGEAISGGTVVTVDKLGGKMHQSCFRCGCSSHQGKGKDVEIFCGKPLSGEPYMVEGCLAVCKICWEQHLAPVCSHCKLRITEGKTVREKGGGSGFVYHVDCFKKRPGKPLPNAIGRMGGEGPISTRIIPQKK